MLCDDFEILSVRVNKHVFSVCYRPPHGNVSSFFLFYGQFLDFVSANGCSVTSAGDFNIDMLANTNEQRNMKMLITSNGCDNAITLPTRITKDNKTLLDLFVTNFDNTDITAGAISCGLSDHLPIFVMVKKQNLEGCKSRPPIFFSIYYSVKFGQLQD